MSLSFGFRLVRFRSPEHWVGVMGSRWLFAVGSVGVLAFACADDGNVLGERSSSGGTTGAGADAGSTSSGRGGSSPTGGSSGRGGSSPTGGSSGGGSTATGGSTGGGDPNGGDAGAAGAGASGDGGSSGDGLGGSAAGGGAGGAGGSGAAGAGGGTAGTNCVDRTCATNEACVAYRTVGGALTFPDDAGACPAYAHKENSYCLANFLYQCVPQPRCSAGSVDCTCGTCPTLYTACRAPYVADWLDTDAKLVCEQLAP